MTAMNIDQAAKELQTLTQYEIDGAIMLSQAIEGLTNQAYREKLLTFKQECEENIKALSELIRQYGREAPTYGRDFKGFFMQGYVALRGLTSDEGIMKALHTNDQITLNAFERLLALNLPDEAKTTVQRIYEAKKNHQAYIESQIQPEESSPAA